MAANKVVNGTAGLPHWYCYPSISRLTSRLLSWVGQVKLPGMTSWLIRVTVRLSRDSASRVKVNQVAAALLQKGLAVMLVFRWQHPLTCIRWGGCWCVNRFNLLLFVVCLHLHMVLWVNEPSRDVTRTISSTTVSAWSCQFITWGFPFVWSLSCSSAPPQLNAM